MGNPAFNVTFLSKFYCHSVTGERNKQDVLRINTNTHLHTFKEGTCCRAQVPIWSKSLPKLFAKIWKLSSE